MARAILPALVLLVILPLSIESQEAAGPTHPMDGLTADEYWAIYDVLRDSGQADILGQIASVELLEPPKAEVLAWERGRPFRREALVVLLQGRETIEAVVDVANRRILDWREVPGVQLLFGVRGAVDALIRSSPEWREAMARRGITDLSFIQCGFTPTAHFTNAENDNRNLVRATCGQARGRRDIAGLVVVVDVDELEIVRVIDTGPLPMVPGPLNYEEDRVGPLRDVPGRFVIQQPQGPGFTVDGHRVRWQNWDFHFRIEPRLGTVLSLIRYLDKGTPRLVLYQASLSEIFIPYMDPSEDRYHWVDFDLGDWASFPAIGVARPLVAGLDCPDHAVFFDSFVPSPNGWVNRRNQSVCLFERDAGDFVWRYAGEGRPRRDLVLRMSTTLGRYHYVLDWVFQQDGSIKAVVGATGTIGAKPVVSRTAAEPGSTAGPAASGVGGGSGGPAHAPVGRVDDDGYGRFVAEHLVGVNHDHFFSFRFDFAVDGLANSLVIDRLRTERLPEHHPRRSVWVIESHTAHREADAMRHVRMDQPERWRVVNPGRLGPWGYPVGYQIAPGHTAMSLLAPDDPLQKRAGFTDYHLWVTPYDPAERYAAGFYPVQSVEADGLSTWTAANRSIEDTDIVAWYTMGFHHVPRAEDWPVAPTIWHEVDLRPVDFFARNPALDLPTRR